ncbi:hypothetical protein CYMTET_43501, partial [Cymbomonas tetramitiformis]
LVAGRTYWVSVLHALRPGDDFVGGILALYVDDKLAWRESPSSTKFTSRLESFVPMSDRAVLKILNDSPEGDKTVFADFVGVTDGNPKLLNGGFEDQPVTDESGFLETTDILAWRSVPRLNGLWNAGGKAIITNGNEAWGGLSSGSGTYYLALQTNNVAIEQRVTGLSSKGVYTISFMYAERPSGNCFPGCIAGGKLSFYVDNVLKWTGNPSYFEFQTFTYSVTPSGSSMLLRFENSAITDKSAVFLDNVVMPGSLLFSDPGFEAGSASEWTTAGNVVVTVSSAATSAGCTINGTSGAYFLSLGSQDSSVKQTISNLVYRSYYWITYKMATCGAASDALLGFYMAGELVWSGSMSVSGAFEVNTATIVAGAASLEFKWVNLGTQAVFLDEAPTATAPPDPEWSVLFDGKDDYLLLPVFDNIWDFSIWVWVDSVQAQVNHEVTLMDATRSAADSSAGERGAVFGELYVGDLWEHVHVNGDPVELDWSAVITDSWMHLHLSAKHAFKDDINVMSKYISGSTPREVPGACKGKLASIYIWGASVPLNDIMQMGRGIYGGYVYNPYSAHLIHAYTMEEGTGIYLWDAMFPGETEMRGVLLPPVGTRPPKWTHENPINPGWHPLHQFSALAPAPPAPPPPVSAPACAPTATSS